jgi:hypothetical protein
MQANGGAGNLVVRKIKISKGDTAFRMVQGICSTASAWTGAAGKLYRVHLHGQFADDQQSAEVTGQDLLKQGMLPLLHS